MLPVLLLALGSAASAESIRLAWDSNPEGRVVGYHVYRSATAGSGYARLTDQPTANPYYVDASVESPGTYYYVATAVDASGNESAFSSEVKAVLGNYDPNPQTTLLAVRILPDTAVEAGQMVVLSGTVWNPEEKSLTYAWSQSSGPGVTIFGTTNSDASFFAPALTSDATLGFLLTVSDGTHSLATDEVQITVHKQ